MNNYVELYPRDWVPDLTRPDGDRPPVVVMIPRQAWIDAGRPDSIEEWQRNAPTLCTCGACPVHGVTRTVKPA